MTHRPPIAKKATRTVFLKSLSLTLILCLLIQEFSYSAPELQKMDLGWRIEDGGEKQKNLNWAKKFLPDIPESIATIEDAWHSSSTSTLHTPGGAGGEASAARNEELHEHSGVPQVTGPGHTVILIQDAHTNNSGQLNEAKLLDILYSQKKNLSNYIFLEAGSGSESLSFLRKYASLEKRQQVAKSFLLQAKLQGTEYLDLTSDHNMTLWGVEDMTLYSKSVELYRRSAQRRQKFSDYLDRVDRTIRTLEPKFLNPYLLVFYQKLREHEQGKLSLQEYLGLLFNEAQKLELTGFKNLKVLQDLKDKEKEINFEEAQKEQAKFITSLSTQEQKEFLEASRSKDEQVHKAFLFLLSDKLKENTAFPNLQKYLTYFKYSQTLNPQEILREQKLLEEKVLDSLITTPDEKELIHASEGVAVLKKLFLLQCTPEDYQTYKKNKSNLSGSTLLTTSIQKITGFLNQKLMNQKDNYDKALFLENGYEDMVRYCEEFYELTYQRDQAFISNMLEVIESTKHPAMGDTEPGRPFTRSEELHEDKWAGAVAGPVAAHLHVLITGGYHTPNLKHLLKQNNISYISLTPQVLQETNLKRYEEILLKQKMPAPFQPANLAHTSMTTRVLAGGRLAELTEALGMKIDQGKWIEDRGWRIEGENQGARLAATSKPESNSPNEFKPSWIRYVAAVSIIATASVLFLNFGVGAPFLLIRPLSITVGNIASMFIQQEKNTGRYLWRLFLAASGGVASTLPVMGYFLLLGGWDNPDIGDYWMKPLADILGFSISANLILFLFMSAKDIDFTKPYKTWIPDIQKEFVRKLKAYFAPKGFYEINTAYWGPIASFCYTIATRSEMELNVVIMAVIYSLPLAFYAAKDPTKKSDGWKQATLERTYLLTPLLSAAMVPLSAWNGNWVGAGQWSWILLSGLAAWGISIGVTRWFIPKVLGIDLNPEKADRTSEPQAARLAGKIEKRMKGRGLRIEENQAGARLANDGSVNIEGLTPLFLRLSPVQAQRETAGARLAETSGKERPEWYLEDAVTDLNEALEVLLDRYVANDNSTPQSRLLMNRLFDRVGLLSRDISRMVEQQSYLDVIPLKNQVNRIHEKLNAVMQVISRTRDITRLTFFEIQLLVADDGLLRSVGDDLNKFVAGARLALHKNLSDIWWALLANVFENDELWPIKFINTKIGTNGMVQIANDVPFSIRRELKILKMQNLTHVLIVHDQNNPEELLIYPAEESDSQRGNFFNSPRPLIGAYYLKNEKMVTAQSIIGDRLKESKQLTKEGEIPKAVLMRVSKKPRKNRIYLFSAEKGRKVYLYSKKVTLGDLLRVEVDSNQMLRVYRLYPGKNRYEILAKGRLSKKGKFFWVPKEEGDSLGDKNASAARLAQSPVSLKGLAVDEQFKKMEVLHVQLKKQKETKDGKFVRVFAFSDIHGSIERMDQFIVKALQISFQDSEGKSIFDGLVLDPAKPLLDQLEPILARNRFHFGNLRDRLFFHNLGDLVDRGEHALDVIERSAQLIELGLGDFVSGNHDDLLLSSMMAIHLPWYDGYNFYGYTDKEKRYGLDEIFKTSQTVEEQVLVYNKTLSNDDARKRDWASKFAEVNRYNSSQQKMHWIKYEEMVHPKQDPPTKGLDTLIDREDLTERQRVLWNKFAGFNLEGVKISTGVRAVGKMSLVWWMELFDAFESEVDMASGPNSIVWGRAEAMMRDHIIPELRDDLKGRLDQSQWWVRVVEALYAQNYVSAEWAAFDWSVHDKWGPSMFREIEAKVLKETQEAVTVDETNYLERPELQRARDFLKEKRNLYLQDIYLNTFAHALMPYGKDGVDARPGEFYFAYKNQLYRGKGDAEKGILPVWEGLERLANAIHDAPDDNPIEAVEAFNVIYQWYADFSAVVKPSNEFEIMGDPAMTEGFFEHNDILGAFIHGHNPLSSYDGKKSLGPMKGAYSPLGTRPLNALINTDGGAAPAYGGQGTMVMFDPASGIRVFGFEKDSKVMTEKPSFKRKKDGTVLFANEGLGGEVYLDSLITGVEAKIAELKMPTAARLADPNIRGTRYDKIIAAIQSNELKLFYEEIILASASELDRLIFVIELNRVMTDRSGLWPDFILKSNQLIEQARRNEDKYLSRLELTLLPYTSNQRNPQKFLESTAASSKKETKIIFDHNGSINYISDFEIVSEGDLTMKQMHRSIEQLLMRKTNNSILGKNLKELTGEPDLSLNKIHHIRVVPIQEGRFQAVFTVFIYLNDDRVVPFVLMMAKSTGLKSKIVRKEYRNLRRLKGRPFIVQVLREGSVAVEGEKYRQSFYSTRFLNNHAEIVYRDGALYLNSSLEWRRRFFGKKRARNIFRGMTSLFIYFSDVLENNTMIDRFLFSARDVGIDETFKKDGNGKYRFTMIAYRDQKSTDVPGFVSELFSLRHLDSKLSRYIVKTDSGGTVYEMDDGMSFPEFIIEGTLDGLKSGLILKYGDVEGSKQTKQWLEAYLAALIENPELETMINHNGNLSPIFSRQRIRDFIQNDLAESNAIRPEIPRDEVKDLIAARLASVSLAKKNDATESGARLAGTPVDFTPDDAVEFLTQVFGEQHGKTGRLWIGSRRFRSHWDQKTQELVILGFGRELLRTKDWKTKRAVSERHVLDRLDARPMDSVGISLSDFKILLQNSFDAAKALPSDPALDQKKALVIINLESLNSKLKGFDNVILPLLIRELAYAHRHSYGKEVKYLLTGRKTSLDVAATLLAEYFREGQDFIYMQGKAVPAEYKHRRASVTNPRKPRRGRNFYIQMPQDGDILNFRATLLLAARLARIKELNVNDSDFIQFKQSLEIFLGRPIEDTADFIAAIESISKNRNRYALPVLASVSGSLALAAARLANSMTEQSA